MQKWMACLRLMRPANVVTAFADVLAGFGIAAIPVIRQAPSQLSYLMGLLSLLLLASGCLYGAALTFNDVCDADLDKIERPERPIPRGILSKKQAVLLASILWLIGLIAAYSVSFVSGLIATFLIIVSISYDAYTKHHQWLGPINIGLGRAGNLLMGISIIPLALPTYWMVVCIPFIYISAVTLVSQGEVNGSGKKVLLVALLLYILSIFGLFLLVQTPHFNLLASLPFIILFGFLTIFALAKAIKNNHPQMIRNAVKTGVICLIILDAAIAAGYAGWWYGMIILLLLPISIGLGKAFAVT